MIKDKHGYMINLSDGNIKVYGHDTRGKLLIVVISSQGDILSQRKV